MAQHDRGYHLLFSHPKLVEDLLKNFMLEDWVNQLDFTGMERVNAKFHTDTLKQRDQYIDQQHIWHPYSTISSQRPCYPV